MSSSNVNLDQEEQAYLEKLEKHVNKYTLHDEIAHLYQLGQPLNVRDGCHLSDVTGMQCTRKAVLAHLYRQNQVMHSQKTAAIFENGTVYVHQRWQGNLERAGVSIAVEMQHVETFWRLLFTPDQIIWFRGHKTVVEYKGWKQEMYDKLVDPITKQQKNLPKDAIIQNMLYQWFLGPEYHHGLVVVENKNNQEFSVWAVKYNPDWLVGYEDLFNAMYRYVQIHQATGKLPPRLDVCSSKEDDKPQSCGCRESCFALPKDRLPMRRPVAWE